MKLRLLVCALLFIAASASEAVVGPVFTLKRDVPQADLVFIGRIMSESPVPGQDKDAHNMVYRYKVVRVLKGEYPVGGTIDLIDHVSHQAPYTHDLVLVKKNSDSSYSFLYVFSTMFIAGKEYSTYSKSADVNANVRWEILNSLKDKDQQIVCEVLRQTAVLTKKDIREEVIPLTKSPDPATSVLAYASCVAAGMDDMYLPALGYVMNYPQKANFRDGDLGELLRVMRLLEVKPEQALLLAKKGMTSKSKEVREVISYMLRKNGDSGAVPHLKKYLDEPDLDVRYNVVMGLYRIIDGNEYAVTHDGFVEKAAEYTKKWKERLAE